MIPVPGLSLAQNRIGVRVRRGPGLSYPEVIEGARVDNGDIVNVHTAASQQADGYTWIKITIDDKALTGWTALVDHARFLSLRTYDMFNYFSTVERSRALEMAANYTRDGELIQLVRDGGRVFMVKGHEPHNARNSEIFVLTESGISRDVDLSHSWTTGYETRDRVPLLWARRFMGPGDRVDFNANLRLFEKDDGSTIQEFPYHNIIELVDVYDIFTTRGGLTLNWVAHFHVYIDGRVNEEMWFAHGHGLCQWIKHDAFTATGEPWQSWAVRVRDDIVMTPIIPGWMTLAPYPWPVAEVPDTISPEPDEPPTPPPDAISLEDIANTLSLIGVTAETIMEYAREELEKMRAHINGGDS